jgi:hypothetical protein
MAGRAAQLPKWQTQQMLCQNLCQIGIANLMPQKIFFILIFFSCVDDILRYNQSIRKRERKMHVNDFIGSLPKIQERKVWKVVDKDGTIVQYVGSTDNRKTTAQKYIDQKYPDRVLGLTFSHFKGLMTVGR